MAASAFPTPKIIGTKQPNVSYIDRFAVRVIAFNPVGKVAIVYSKRDNYYKLPGGGIDPNEQHEMAAMREMQEETGGLIKIRRNLGCIATTEEYRNDLHQMSYCYVADVVDDSGSPNLTEDEVSDGLGHFGCRSTRRRARWLKQNRDRNWASISRSEIFTFSRKRQDVRKREGYKRKEALWYTPLKIKFPSVVPLNKT